MPHRGRLEAFGRVNDAPDEQCAVYTLSCYGGWYSPGQNGQHLWYMCMEQNGLLVGI